MAVIELLVPNLASAVAGNTVTAGRYRGIFADLGHEVAVVSEPSGTARLVVALNAYRSAAGIEQAAAGQAAILVVLTGTDIYRFLTTEPDVVQRALDRATHLVGLNDRIGLTLSPQDRAKLTIIKEGARVGLARSPSSAFSVAVVGHLRDEKAPRLLARAVADLPAATRLTANHYGAAYSETWARWARRETRTNSRYQWHGEVPRTVIDEVYATSHVLVNCSAMEGGANVLSEAIMAGLPVVAADIAGNVGVLGNDYPGYFPAGDAAALTDLLQRLVDQHQLLAELETAVRALQSDFTTEREQQRWAALFDELGID